MAETLAVKSLCSGRGWWVPMHCLVTATVRLGCDNNSTITTQTRGSFSLMDVWDVTCDISDVTCYVSYVNQVNHVKQINQMNLANQGIDSNK